MNRSRQAALTATAIMLSGCASSLHRLESSIIFQPHPFPDSKRLPSDAEFEDAWVESTDGVKLHGWFAEAENPTAVVLYCHGNAGNVSHRRPVLRMFRENLDASIFVFDYRGYGRSEGTPTEEGILADARACRRWLAKRTGVKESEIVIVGNSLGGGVAVDLAAKDGARALVLENTFTSLPAVAASRFGSPVASLMTLKLASASKIADYRGPLLQTHGTDDTIIPFELGRALFDAANEPKRFIEIPGGGHNDPPMREYLRELRRFLREL
jgi:fermentation-respiration switch protein FrsA (DUF1100 family)